MKSISSKIILTGVALAIIGAALSALAFAAGGQDLRRLLFSLLLNFAFFLSLALGGLLWVVLHHLTSAGWSVTLRRMGEAVASSVMVLALVAIPLLALLPQIYLWAVPKAVAADALLRGKAAYLNGPFFIARAILYFAIWIYLARFYLRHSLRQDATGDPALTRKMEKWSPLAMLLLAFSITFFSFDFLMSLDPRWFSTIFGVYYFSGAMAGFFALLALIAVAARGRFAGQITIEHLHDVGKLMFSFVIFWAYIAFSQYLLIWYGNLPEETAWLARRAAGSWMGLTYALLIGHFIIPFIGLLSRYPKRNPKVLAFWAVWILAMHYLDLFWLIMPEYRQGTRILGFAATDATLFLTVCGLFLIGSALPLRRHALAPTGDPRLAEALAFENM